MLNFHSQIIVFHSISQLKMYTTVEDHYIATSQNNNPTPLRIIGTGIVLPMRRSIPYRPYTAGTGNSYLIQCIKLLQLFHLSNRISDAASYGQGFMLNLNHIQYYNLYCQSFNSGKGSSLQFEFEFVGQPNPSLQIWGGRGQTSLEDGRGSMVVHTHTH